MVAILQPLPDFLHNNKKLRVAQKRPCQIIVHMLLPINLCKMALGLSTSSYWEIQGQCLLLQLHVPTFYTSHEGPRNSEQNMRQFIPADRYI